MDFWIGEAAVFFSTFPGCDPPSQLVTAIDYVRGFKADKLEAEGLF
jgi:hypothetical protein